MRRMIVVLSLLVTVAAAAAEPDGVITLQHDRFRGTRTLVMQKPVASKSQRILNAGVGVFRPDDPTALANQSVLILTLVTTDITSVGCSTLYVLAGDARFTFESRREDLDTQDGIFIESFVYVATGGELVKMARAATIEMRICMDELTMTNRGLAELAARRFPPTSTSTPARALTIDQVVPAQGSQP